MPGTLWSAPSSTQSNTSLVTSVFTTGALTDISPSQCFIGASTLNPGTRIRLHAVGEYSATTAASSVTWGFYMTAVGGLISGTASAALATTASTAVVSGAAAFPFILDYSGVVQTISIAQNNTTAKIVGQGTSLLPLTLNSFTGPLPIPTTAAARTVTQTTTITGLNTETNLYASIGATVAVNTGLTSITVDELTCELIG